jgi:hypothetical protein
MAKSHENWRLILEAAAGGLHPDLRPGRAQADPVPDDRGAAQARLYRRTASDDRSREIEVRPDAPLAGPLPVDRLTAIELPAMTPRSSSVLRH